MGMIATYLVIMGLIAQTILPPLAIPAVLFAISLALTRARPRASAVAIGVLSALWLLAGVVRAPQVIDGLVRPASGLPFLVTLAFQVLSLGGVVGLIGSLRRASGRAASRTLQVVAAALLSGAVVMVVALLVA